MQRRPTQPITPPLLPLTPPMTPYIPSSPANNIPLLSEDSNSTTAEATSLQNEIMAADALFRHDFNGDDPMHLDTNAREELSFNLKTRGNDGKRKLEDVKVEGPLTPPIFSDSPLKKIKSVSFSAMVQFIPEIPSTYENGEDILCPEDDFAGFYQDTIPLVEDANGRISNERLSVADTTKRVDVPYLEFPLPVMPWGEYKKPYNNSNGTELDAQTKFMLHVKRFSMKTAETWYGVAKLEKNLRWEPAPTHMFKVPVDEKLHGEENLCKLLQDPNPGDVVTCASAIWHGDRLRILENDDEEEELEHQEYEDEWNGEKMDLSALARKRKLELDEAEDNAECGNKALKRRVTKPNDDPRSKRAAARHSPVGDRCKIGGTRSPSSHPNNSQIKTRKKPSSLRIETHASLMFGGKFSASNSLENFLAIQGMSLAPLKVHKQPPSTEPAPVPLPPKDQQHNSASTSANIDPDHKIQQHRPPPPLAPIPDHLLPCSFIMSSTLLQQRHLSKQIGQLYPAAEFVTRDFALPHSTSQEADLLLSPSTGLIVTTLQQVKQRALPGQPDHSPLKSRIATLQHRYERLVVLITEGLTREMESHGSTRPPDVRDQDAVRVFEAFASGLEGEALVHYVPGGETALARSVVGEMARYGLAHGSADIGDIKPLPDETNVGYSPSLLNSPLPYFILLTHFQWELFLRRAGLNPFAAQAILAWLKQPVEYPLASSSPASGSAGQAHTVRTFGLQTFLMMSADRRVQNFQAMLGGARVLRRVSGVLDGEWVSAAHGYRM